MKQGGKAISLYALQRGGFSVPLFFVCGLDWSEEQILAETCRVFPSTQYFAVRSSAENEDSKEKSFAGFFYTGIGVPREDIFTEVMKVRGSFGDMQGSVIVQEFIPSERAGVLFTEVQNNLLVINATIGLCEPVVRGEKCDEYLCDKKSSLLRKSIATHKSIRIFQDGKIVVAESDEESLSGAEIIALVQLANKIQTYFHTPQDVEWCFYKGALFVLQSRPITKDLTIVTEEHFDSANIAESYSGIVLPLTCSFAKMVYEEVYKDFLQMSGVSRKNIEQHSNIFENLLGFFYGRMYYNMNNWYHMAEFVPGYRRNKENFELMITSNVSQSVAASIKPSTLLSIVYPLIVGAKVAVFGITSAYFAQRVRAHLAWLREHDFVRLNYVECITLFHALNKALLRRWYITLENDFFVMTYLGILKKMIGEEHLQKALVFPSKATEQVLALTSLSAHMRAHDEVWHAIESDNVSVFTSALSQHIDLDVELKKYLSVFGGRFANELKLESVGVDEDTRKLFAVLKAYTDFKPKQFDSRFDIPLPFFKRMVVKVVLQKFKKYASRREEFRLLRSNTFGMARRLFRRMGVVLVEKGVLTHPDDVFYLELAEILSETADTNKELSANVAKRKKEYTSFEDISLPSHFSTHTGCLSVANTPPTDERKSILLARPASPGVVRGIVKVFKEFSMPSEIDFDILVTSHTDPGWTSLIALSKGLIIEHGGVLSHASIVARELGIPAVIGAAYAVSTLLDGQMVEIDGSRGTITIL